MPSGKDRRGPLPLKESKVDITLRTVIDGGRWIIGLPHKGRRDVHGTFTQSPATLRRQRRQWQRSRGRRGGEIREWGWEPFVGEQRLFARGNGPILRTQ